MLNSMDTWIPKSIQKTYVEKLKEISNKTLAEGESGLGLVRIAYEGQSILDFYVNENNLLAVSAVYQY